MSKIIKEEKTGDIYFKVQRSDELIDMMCKRDYAVLRMAFSWFIEDCQYGPKSEGYSGEVPSMEDLEHEWASDHPIPPLCEEGKDDGRDPGEQEA